MEWQDKTLQESYESLDLSTSSAHENMNSDDNEGESSFTSDWPVANSCFRRYWQHHSNITAWFRECRKQTYNAFGQQDIGQWYRQLATYHSHMANYMLWQYHTAVMSGSVPVNNPYHRHHTVDSSQDSVSQDFSFCSATSKLHSQLGKSRKKRKKKSRGRRHKRHLSSSGLELHIANLDPENRDLDVDISANGEGVEFEFEITDDLMEFFTQTAKHRKERELVKAGETADKSDEVVYVDLSSVSANRGRPTVLPPQEQTGARRLSEMRELYGSGAAKIHGMETAVQLTFDRNLDRHKPRLWPAVPLNIRFD